MKTVVFPRLKYNSDMDAEMAKLKLDTEQKKVSRDISTLPSLVLEKIISDLDLVQRTKLSATNKFFYEFVPRGMLELDTVRIIITFLDFSSNEIEFTIDEGSNVEEERLNAGQFLEKLLNSKEVKVNKFIIECLKKEDLPKEISCLKVQRLKARQYLGKLLSSKNKVEKLIIENLKEEFLPIFPKEIICLKVQFTRCHAKAMEKLLKRMKINMEEIEFTGRETIILDSVLRSEQMRTADSVDLSHCGLSSSILYECKNLKKVHMNARNFEKEYGFTFESTIRHVIQSWLNGDCPQLREMKVDRYNPPMFSLDELIAELPNVRMTSSRYKLGELTRWRANPKEDRNPRDLIEGDVAIFKNFRFDKLSTDSTSIGHANIDFHGIRNIKLDHLSEQIKARLVNHEEIVGEIPLNDEDVYRREVDLTVTFEDMNAEMAKLKLDTEQKEEKVSGDIDTFSTLVVEKIMSDLGFVQRQRPNITNENFDEFDPAVMLKSVNIVLPDYRSDVIGVTVDESTINFAWPRHRFFEDEHFEARQFLEKVLSNKNVKTDKLCIANLEHEFLSIFPKEIICRKVQFTCCRERTIQCLLKRMEINMEEIEIMETYEVPDYVLCLEQIRTANFVSISHCSLSPSIIYECRNLKKVHINASKFKKIEIEDEFTFESSVRNVIENWLNGECPQLREMKINGCKASEVPLDILFAEMPNVQVTSSSYKLDKLMPWRVGSKKLGDRYDLINGHVNLLKTFRVDKLSANSTLIGHADIVWRETRGMKLKHLSRQIKIGLVNGDKIIGEIPLSDEDAVSPGRVDLTVRFEDYQ